MPMGLDRMHQRVPRGSYYLTSSAPTWSKRQSASWASLQVTPTQEKRLICWRARLRARGTVWEMSWKNRPTRIFWSSTEINARSCTWGRNTPCPGTGVASRHPGSWESWQTPHPTCVSNVTPAGMEANFMLGCLEGTDCCPLIVVVRMPLAYCVQFRALWWKYWQTAESEEKLWWLASWTGWQMKRGGGTFICLARGNIIALFHDPKGGYREDEARLCSEVHSGMIGGSCHRL